MLFPEVRGTAAATPPPAESEEDLDDICKTLLVNACRGNACILKGGGVTEARGGGTAHTGPEDEAWRIARLAQWGAVAGGATGAQGLQWGPRRAARAGLRLLPNVPAPCSGGLQSAFCSWVGERIDSEVFICVAARRRIM